MLPIIFVIPIIQLLVLIHAATFEMKNIRIILIDNDLSLESQQLVNKFKASDFFEISDATFSVKEAISQIESDNADVVLEIPANFASDLRRNNSADIQLLINAINATVAGLSNAYTSSVIAEFNKNIVTEWLQIPELKGVSKDIQTTWSFWYNPKLNYKTYMLPGILVLLVTIIGLFLSGLNLVREKEIGTIEQINVTPIKKYQFIIGKLLPFWFIALFELAFGMAIGKLFFDIPFVGSVPLIFGIAGIYLIAILGLGLFFSTLANTQQQLMFIAFFFLLVFILMSGLFTSVESMPDWAQKLNYLNPIAYFIKLIRLILLKGSGLKDIVNELLALTTYAILVVSLAVFRYRKTA